MNLISAVLASNFIQRSLDISRKEISMIKFPRPSLNSRTLLDWR